MHWKYTFYINSSKNIKLYVGGNSAVVNNENVGLVYNVKKEVINFFFQKRIDLQTSPFWQSCALYCHGQTKWQIDDLVRNEDPFGYTILAVKKFSSCINR